MSYVIIKTNGTVLTTIPDGTINSTSTSIDLPGRLYPGYGQVVDTNFVHILENFASPVPPENPLQGQLWFNTFDNTLCVCPQDGETNALAWYTLITSSAVANVTAGNLNVSGNISANNITLTNNVEANLVDTDYLTVNIQANIANANVTGNANLTTVNTSIITTGATNIKGNLTGAWTVLGANTLNGVPGTAMWITGGNLLVTGIKTDNWYYANGVAVSFAGTYTNSNVLSYLATLNSNVGAVSSGTAFNGNILSTGSSATAGTITGNWTLSAGSKLSGIPSIDGANITGTVANANYSAFAGNVVNAAQSNITSLGTLTALNINGVTTGVRFVSNVATGTAPLTVTSTTKVTNLNADAVDGYDTAIANTASTVAVRDTNGNISANFFIGNGSQLSGLNTDRISNGTSNVSIPAVNGNVRLVSAGNVTLTVTGTGANITGTANVSGNLSAGNISATNIVGTLTTAAQTNITSLGTLDSLTVSGDINSTNVNVSGGGSFYGNGAGLTNIPYTSIVGTIPTSDFATTAGTVITAAQPNITSVGTLTTLSISGTLSFTGSSANLGQVGNIIILGGSAGQVLSTNGSGGLSWVSAAAADTAITVTANAQPNITSVGTLTSVNSSGNVVGSNVKTSTGAFYGNGAGLTNIPGGNVTGTVPSASYATSAGSVASIPSGTRMLFAQTSAPTGWTKLTSNDDAALRVVSGAAGSGGTVGFTTAFASKAVTGTVGATALTESQLPAHRHYMFNSASGSTDISTYPASVPAWAGLSGGDTEYSIDSTNAQTADYGYTDTTGSGATHTHTFSGTAINLAVKYVDVIIAQKD